MLRFLTTALCTLAIYIPASANAAIITQQFDLTTQPIGSLPYKNIFGRFTITFDNSRILYPTAAGLSVEGFNLNNISLLYTYNDEYDALTIGTTLYQGGWCAQSAGDFCFFVYNVSTDLNDDLSPVKEIFYNFNYGTRFITKVNSTAVPEPSTWALLVAGFTAVGMSLRRRRTISASHA